MKIPVRYFFAPICPEAFASEMRLKALFARYPECNFESFNLANDCLKSDYPWFPNEEALLRAVNSGTGKAYSYGALFFQGQEVKGFPPSPQLLEEVVKAHGLPWYEDGYTIPYKLAEKGERRQAEVEPEEIVIRRYEESELSDVCALCSKYHPALMPDEYDSHYWSMFEEEKKDFLYQHLLSGKLVGVIAYRDHQPLGFAEGFSLRLAARMGFPVTKPHDEELMITCLSVRAEFSGCGIASKLLKEFEDVSLSAGYKSLEVLAFPDEHCWQPKALYGKNGFQVVREIGNLSLMTKSLC